jgi:hypothetical protein
MSAIRTCWTTLALSCLIVVQTVGALSDAIAETDNLRPLPNRSLDVKLRISTAQDVSRPDSTDKPASPADSGSKDQDKSSAVKGAPDEIQVLKTKIIEFQNNGKLGFRKVALCSSVEGFGIYSLLEPGQAASRILLYFEPSNFSTLVSAGRYIVDLAVDLSIFNAAGKLIAGKENALKINRVSRSPIIDLYYKMEINLKRPLKQHIIVKTTLRDKIKNQSISASYKVNVHSAKDKMLDQI